MAEQESREGKGTTQKPPEETKGTLSSNCQRTMAAKAKGKGKRQEKESHCCQVKFTYFWQLLKSLSLSNSLHLVHFDTLNTKCIAFHAIFSIQTQTDQRHF